MPKRAPRNNPDASSTSDDSGGRLPELKTFQPTDRNSRIFWSWAVWFRPVEEIAFEMGETVQAVNEAIQGVAERKLQDEYGDVNLLRVRHSVALENWTGQALQRWRESSDIRYLEQSRKLTVDIRKMWGADKPPQADKKEDRRDEMPRVVGLDRRSAILATANQLLKLADELAALNPSVSANPL